MPRSPEIYAFEFTPWAEILGFEISPQNAEDVGAAQLASQVLWEMTFFGFSEDKVDEERKKLDRSIQEAAEIEKLPPEEREKRLVPAEKVFTEFGYEDTRTEEEKDAEKGNFASLSPTWMNSRGSPPNQEGVSQPDLAS